MNVNEKGVKGLIKVIDDLQEKGFLVFTSFDDHSPIDLIAVDKHGKSYRLQVKYREKNPRKIKERYGIQATSVVNGKKIPIDRSMIDGWAVYLSNSKKVVYINKTLLDGKNELTIDPEKDYGDMAEWTKAASC
jgi:hypothetical protein